MPVIVSSYIRANPNDNSFGLPAEPPVAAQPGVLTTQRGKRFSGYHLTHDTSGNVLLFMPPQTWLNQPTIYVERGLTFAKFDFRAP